jgi:hypothetical protein
MEAFLIVLQAIMTLIVGYIGTKIKKRETERKREQEEQEALRDGVRAVLRDRIVQAHNNFSRIGSIEIEELENISNMYIAYHNLGGNGVVTNVYNRILEIPIKKSTH